jgi:hypothetical protein
VGAVRPQDRPDHAAPGGVRLLHGDDRVAATGLQLVAPEVGRLVHLRELDEPVQAGDEAVVGAAPIDPQGGVLADEDVDGVPVEAPGRQLGDRRLGGLGGGEHAHQVIGRVAQQPAARARDRGRPGGRWGGGDVVGHGTEGYRRGSRTGARGSQGPTRGSAGGGRTIAA